MNRQYRGESFSSKAAARCWAANIEGQLTDQAAGITRKVAGMTAGALVRASWVPNDVPNGKILVAPLTVLDTASANIQLQSENDDSEVADALFAIREGTIDPESRTQLPVALIGHVAKAFKLADCRDAEKMNTTGSQAWDANVHSNYFMMKEGETRTREIRDIPAYCPENQWRPC